MKNNAELKKELDAFFTKPINHANRHEYIVNKDNILQFIEQNFVPKSEYEIIANSNLALKQSTHYMATQIEPLTVKIKQLKAENERLKKHFEHIRDAFWTDGEPYKERFEYLQAYSKDALQAITTDQSKSCEGCKYEKANGLHEPCSTCVEYDEYQARKK